MGSDSAITPGPSPAGRDSSGSASAITPAAGGRDLSLPARPAPAAARFDLFLISLLLLFLELSCIRWFPAHVLYLTFFTNIVLLASFLGLSIGCLASSSRANYLRWTPVLLVLAVLAGLGVEEVRRWLELSLDVGRQESPEVVFFGTEQVNRDIAQFVVPIDVLGGSFFLLVTLAMIGPGQELGRALERVPDRVQAYTINIAGSIAGILLFDLCAWYWLPPIWWFGGLALGLAYFLLFRVPRGSLAMPVPRRHYLVQGLLLLCLAAAAWLASQFGGERRRAPEEQRRAPEEHWWSPYYRIDYRPPDRMITTNLIGHQRMEGLDSLRPSYALPHLLRRDAHPDTASPPGPYRSVLIIGAGSGNDVSRALQWGAEHVDAVEIDPVIQSLGARHHPDRPYDDPRVTVHLDDGRNFLRAPGREIRPDHLRPGRFARPAQQLQQPPAGELPVHGAGVRRRVPLPEAGGHVRDVQLLPAGMDRGPPLPGSEDGVRHRSAGHDVAVPGNGQGGGCVRGLHDALCRVRAGAAAAA